MNPSKPQLILFGAIFLIITIFVLILLGVIPGLQNKNAPEKTKAQIEFWGIFDTPDQINGALTALKKNYPQVTVNYRSFNNENDYATALLENLAAGKGPDIFMVRNSALLKERDKIIAAPQTLITSIDLKKIFPQVVEQDFSLQGLIYGLPLSIDTLAMIYNRDLLNKAALMPPQTWEEFIKNIPLITKVDSVKTILEAGAALGTAKNIDHASDILNVLMLQTGTKMISADFRETTFNSQEGINALNFYTQFSNAGNVNYTWNGSLPNSLEAMSQNKVAVVFDYAEALPKIRARNNFINLGVAPLPQPQSAVKSIAYPNYFGLVVAKQSKQQTLAWQIIKSLTTDPATALSYLQNTKRPPALLSLVNSFDNDQDLTIFAKQIFIARSWPQKEQKAFEQVFLNAINAVVENHTDVKKALDTAVGEINQILQKSL